MKKTLWAVKLHNVITNISYECEGQTKWCKAIFDSEEQANERRDYMNEIKHHDYRVVPITITTSAKEKV